MNVEYIRIVKFDNMNAYYLFYNNGCINQFDIKKGLLEHEMKMIDSVVNDDIQQEAIR